MKKTNHMGKRYGMLCVIASAKPVIDRSGQTKARWIVFCDCGRVKTVRASDLASGNTKSCGCVQAQKAGGRTRTHGLTKAHPLYGIWAGIRDRCFCKTDPAYYRYGGRGITMCERWNDFTLFIADMGERPEGFQIERKDNNGDYSPENCIWASRKTQCRNTRRNINITLNGETLCLLDWCKRQNLPYARVRARIKVLGWSPEKSLGL